MERDDYYMDPRVAERYDLEYGDDFGGDREFYLGLAREAAAAGHEVLELAVGTGRLAIPIAQAGARITGLDRSPAMLAVAHRKAGGLENLILVEGDMARFELEKRFGLVIIPFRSFLHLVTVADQKSCLRCVFDHLLPGGRLALNFFNPDVVMIADWLTSKKGGLSSLPDAGTVEGGPTVKRWTTRTYSTAGQTVDDTRIEEELSDDGAVISRVYRGMRLRYVFRYEMQYLLELTGFEIEALYGGFAGEPFEDASKEMVWVARKV